MTDHMKKKNRWRALRTGLLTAAAVMLVMSAVLGSAWAYFTTYARAKGGYVINLGHNEHMGEFVKNWNKIIHITLSEDSNPVYLRARAFCAEYPLIFSDEEVKTDGGIDAVNVNWVPKGDDGWYYYSKVYKPVKDSNGEIIPADPLYVRICHVPKTVEQGAREGDEFNVIIVYETTEVQYDSAGKPLDWKDVDWDKKVSTGRNTVSDSGSSDSGAKTGGK